MTTTPEPPPAHAHQPREACTPPCPRFAAASEEWGGHDHGPLRYCRPPCPRSKAPEWKPPPAVQLVADHELVAQQDCYEVRFRTLEPSPSGLGVHDGVQVRPGDYALCGDGEVRVVSDGFWRSPSESDLHVRIRNVKVLDGVTWAGTVWQRPPLASSARWAQDAATMWLGGVKVTERPPTCDAFSDSLLGFAQGIGCSLPAGHIGMHRSSSGTDWVDRGPAIDQAIIDRGLAAMIEADEAAGRSVDELPYVDVSQLRRVTIDVSALQRLYLEAEVDDRPTAGALTADGQVVLAADGEVVAMAASRSWAELLARHHRAADVAAVVVEDSAPVADSAKGDARLRATAMADLHGLGKVHSPRLGLPEDAVSDARAQRDAIAAFAVRFTSVRRELGLALDRSIGLDVHPTDRAALNAFLEAVDKALGS